MGPRQCRWVGSCSSHRLPALPTETTLVSGTVWPQFAMQLLTGVCQPPYWGKDGRMGSEKGESLK